ncbi:MAG: hypothetical protein ACLRPU_04855 [Enterococcus hulanensis]
MKQKIGVPNKVETNNEKEYLKKLREKEKTIYYEYIYFDEESNQEEQFFVYFIDGKVAWMSFPKKKV